MAYIYIDKDNIGSVQLKDSSIMTSLRKNKGALLKYGSQYPQYFRRYNLDIKENKYITINQKSSTNKILKISTIKDLDKFNEKFCIINESHSKDFFGSSGSFHLFLSSAIAILRLPLS